MPEQQGKNRGVQQEEGRGREEGIIKVISNKQNTSYKLLALIDNNGLVILKHIKINVA